jgi:hypothetical protein
VLSIVSAGREWRIAISAHVHLTAVGEWFEAAICRRLSTIDGGRRGAKSYIIFFRIKEERVFVQTALTHGCVLGLTGSAAKKNGVVGGQQSGIVSLPDQAMAIHVREDRVDDGDRSLLPLTQGNALPDSAFAPRCVAGEMLHGDTRYLVKVKAVR